MPADSYFFSMSTFEASGKWAFLFKFGINETWHHWGSYPLPKILGSPLIEKLQDPLNLSGRTFSYFGPPYQYLCRTP